METRTIKLRATQKVFYETLVTLSPKELKELEDLFEAGSEEEIRQFFDIYLDYQDTIGFDDLEDMDYTIIKKAES